MKKSAGRVHIDRARLMKEIDVRVRVRAIRMGQRYERNWVNSLKGPKTGRIYRVGKRGRTHQASAPGETPAVMTGRLRRSIKRQLIKERDAAYRVRITWNATYMKFLEFGTSRMRPRPSVRRALRMLYSQMREIMAKTQNAIASIPDVPDESN